MPTLLPPLLDEQEVAHNLHIPSLRFAMESKSMKGKKQFQMYLSGKGNS